MQSTKGMNPFLFETDYGGMVGAGTDATINAVNPFLSDFDCHVTPQADLDDGAAMMGAEINPFLSYQPETTFPTVSNDLFEIDTVEEGAGATNPFASFVDASMDNNNFQPANALNDLGVNMFGLTMTIDHGASLFGGEEQPHHAAVDQLLDIHEDPARPPPASVPSSTQDLLETVTGALEATSDSLLDRLRATQPSPIPQVIQPSPSPRSPSPDLMMDDDSPPPPPPSANPLHPSPGFNQVDSIMEFFDTPKSIGPKSSQEILGLYNSMATSTTVSKAEPLLDLLDSLPIVEATDTAHTESQPHPQPTAHIGEQDRNEPLVEEVKVSEIIVSDNTTATIPMSPLHIIDVLNSTNNDVMTPKAPAQPMRPPPPLPTAAGKCPPERPKMPPVQPQMALKPEVKPPEPALPTPEQKSPLPNRPPPPVPPAPRVSPQPKVSVVEVVEPDQIKSPSPLTVTSKVPTPPTTSPSPTTTSIKTQDAWVDSSDNSTATAPDVTSSAGKGAFASIFGSTPNQPTVEPKPLTMPIAAASVGKGDAFDAFEAKFSQASGTSTSGSAFDAFGSVTTQNSTLDSAWGDGSGFTVPDAGAGFGMDGFDSFLSLTEPPPVPQSTPAKRSQAGDDDDFDADEEEKDMAIVIKPKADKDFTLTLAPALAPPPKSPAMSTGSAFSDDNTAFVPFLSSVKDSKSGARDPPPGPPATAMHKSDSQDSPQTPLYEEDQSQPLEDFPRIQYVGDGWEMHMRLPNKKKITGQRFWKKVFVKVGHQNDVPVVQIYNNKGEKDPFQEIPLQPCYSVSEISAQQFDQYGKVFTVKLQYIFYKERPGVRPGQLSKASRISDKLTQFAAYAIQGDYSGVKEFGSDLKKLGAPIEHSPQISQLVKLGVHSFEEVKQYSTWIEENLFRMSVHRDRAINYKTEEIQVTIVDEYFVEQDIYGVVTRQIARVRLFFLSFLNGVADVEMGVNDLRRQGKEIVGRHDIIPVPTEEWIRMEAIEFSNCVQLDEFDNTQTIKFKPPDACYIELMRFRVRPPRHRELPLQVKTVFTIVGQRIEMRSDILVPGFTSRKLGQIPCEDVMVRFPIPEEWIYMFRVEKHFRYGSVKSAHRRSGKVKGIERFLGAVEAVEQSLMETTSGQAKYEHHHKAIVWRIPRLPKEGQGAYTTHSFFCHITLQAHERIPENLTKHCYVEFTMPHTTVSHTVCRSISVPSCDEPPEKCCRYLSRHEYIVEIEHSQGVTPATYTAAAAVQKEVPPPPEEEIPMPGKAESDSDFSDD